MAKFKVIGADGDSGIDMTEIIKADNSKEATAIAQARGMLITSIERLDEDEAKSTPAINIVNASNSGHVGNGRSEGEVIHPGGGIYALLSFFAPGLGQGCKGQVAAGILWFLVVIITYPIIIGLFLHIWCIIDAAKPVTK